MVLAHNMSEGLRTQDVQISEDVTFDTMLLTPSTLEGLTNSGFYKPSPIQLHGIPLGKCGFDLVLEAKSGTGKTAVFTTIALEKLDIEKGLQAIILAPTREIAAQISDVIKQLGSGFKNLNVEVVIGGLPTHEDIAKFNKKVHIVVGSPGRLRHLIQANHVDVSAVRLFVLDEADKLMDKTFQADINYIFSVLPKEKQVIMSSATYPEILKSVMNKYVQNAQHICPDSTTVLLGIKQLVVTVKCNSNIVRQTQNRFEELIKILSKKQFKQCLIFCNYQVRVRDICKMLMRHNWPAEQLHGQQDQTDRLDALRTLQEYKCRILVSTDLAARGIDASNVDLVINFEPPYEWQTYLHRIGRAGRFGSYGIAVTILSEGQEELKFIRTIKAINSSLDLNNLWDEEKFDLDGYDSSPEKPDVHDIKNIEAINELLNRLTYGDGITCDGEKESQEESGITLNKSFANTTKTKIESFNDLLSSFESHKVNNNDSVCKQLEKDLLLNSTFNLETNLLSKLKKNQELEENLLKIRHKIKSANESHILKEIIVDTIKANDKHEEQLENKNKTKGVQKHQDFGTRVDDNGLCDLACEESYMHKALLDAGLPTSFSSSKNNRQKPKMKNYDTFRTQTKREVNAQESIYIKNKEVQNRNEYGSTGIMPSNIEKETHINGQTKLTFSDQPHNPQPEVYNANIKIKELYTSHKKQYKDHIRHYNENINTTDSTMYSHENKINNDRHGKYAMWYNQLRIHINHIQMSVYIDELSKM